MKEKRCVICEEKIVGGKCVGCGMDYSRNERRYRLNENRSSWDDKIQPPGRQGNTGNTSNRNRSTRGVSSAQRRSTSSGSSNQRRNTQGRTATSAGRKTSGRNTTVLGKTSTNRQSAGSGQSNNRRPVNTTNRPSADRTRTGGNSRDRKKKGIGGKLFAFIIICVAIASVFEELPRDLRENISSYFESVTGIRDIWEDEDSGASDVYGEEDLYGEIEEEIPEDGESYTRIITQGYYTGGKHIPVGTYKITVVDTEESQYGFINLEDAETGIFLSENMGNDQEDSSIVQEVDDIIIYEGCSLEVYGSLRLEVTTENAQMEGFDQAAEQLEAETALLPSEQLTTDITWTVGETIPAGYYDLTAVAGEGAVSITRDGYESWIGWLTADGVDSTYENMDLQEGDKVQISYGSDDCVIQFGPGGRN